MYLVMLQRNIEFWRQFQYVFIEIILEYIKRFIQDVINFIFKSLHGLLHPRQFSTAAAYATSKLSYRIDGMRSETGYSFSIFLKTFYCLV